MTAANRIENVRPDSVHGGIRFSMIVVCLMPVCALSGCGPNRDAGAPLAKQTVPALYKDWPFDKEEALRRQRETAEALGLPVEKDVDLGGGVMLRLVLIPAGRFIMGSPFSEPYRGAAGASDETRHEVTITRPYYLGKYELTQEQWQAVMGDNPSTFKGAGYPVENVGWVDAIAFCEKASCKLGLPVRLPTEAEWEYACRAGTTKAFGESGEVEALDAAGWYGANSGAQLHRVGEKAPNHWGLYDMRGNVWEWCQDWFAPYSPESVTDPHGPVQGEDRVLRGGCWRNPPDYCRSAARDFDQLEDRSGFVGFRVALEATCPGRFSGPATSFDPVGRTQVTRVPPVVVIKTWQSQEVSRRFERRFRRSCSSYCPPVNRSS